MEKTSDFNPIIRDNYHVVGAAKLTQKSSLLRETSLITVGKFDLSNFDAVAVAAAVLMICGPLLAAVIRVG